MLSDQIKDPREPTNCPSQERGIVEQLKAILEWWRASRAGALVVERCRKKPQYSPSSERVTTRSSSHTRAAAY